MLWVHVSLSSITISFRSWDFAILASNTNAVNKDEKKSR